MAYDTLEAAIFLDRDGVINELIHEVPDEQHNPHNYVLSWDDFKFIPEAIKGLQRLAMETEYKLFVVSNQGGIGRGWVSYIEIEEIFEEMCHTLYKAGAEIRDYLFCPHLHDIGCVCRKPQPGMLYSLAMSYDIDLSKSWMIGDSENDIMAGHNAGISNLIKIAKYTTRSVCYTKDYKEDISHIAVPAKPNLLEAAEIIINASQQT